MSSDNKSESRFLKGRTDIKIVVLGSSGKGQMLSLQRLGVDGVITDYVNMGAL